MCSSEGSLRGYINAAAKKPYDIAFAMRSRITLILRPLSPEGAIKDKGHKHSILQRSPDVIHVIRI